MNRLEEGLESAEQAGQAGPRRWLPAPLAVFVLVLLLALAASFVVRGFAQQQQLARFELQVSSYERELRQRLQNYGRLLGAVRAAWEAPGGLTEAQFRVLVAGLNLGSSYPGLRSVGFAPLISAAERPGFAAQLPYLSGVPGARLHPASSGPTSVPVLYLAPALPSNRGVIGFDMATEATRRRALEEAVRSGEVTATGRVTLANTTLRDREGMLLFLSVRSQGQAVGLLYVPVQLSAVLPAPAAGPGEQRLRVDISLDSQSLNSQLPKAEQTSGFSQRDVLEFSGQRWTLLFSSPPGDGSGAASPWPWAVLLAGLLVALLAALATQAQVSGRRRAEETSHRLRVSQRRLERSRAEFEAVFQAIQDLAVFADPQGRVLFANDALYRTLGLKPGELRGSRLSDLHRDPQLLRRLDALPGPHLVTTQFLGPRGQSFYGEMQRSVVRGEDGETLGQLEVIRDISERLQADRLRREGERRYQGVLEAMPQIVFLTDAAGHLSYVNRRWTDYLGPLDARQDTLNQPSAPHQPAAPDFLSVLHPDDRADFSRRWQAARRSGRELETEHRLRGKGGGYRTFMTRGRAVRGEAGEVLEWVMSSTDIEDQVYGELTSRLLADFSALLSARLPPRLPLAEGPAADSDSRSGNPDELLEAALRLSTQRFADVAVLWRAQPEGQPPSAAGSGSWALPGQPEPLMAAAGRLTPPPDPATLEALLGLVLTAQHRSEPTVFQSKRLHAYGLTAAALFPLSRAASPDEYPGDQADSGPGDGPGEPLLEPLGVLGLGFRQPVQERDLEVGAELAQRLRTALASRRLLVRLEGARNSLRELNNSLEEKVLERTAQLHEANVELEAFSYSVSHDLRTPLRHILGFGDLLRRESGAGLSDKGQRYLKVMTDAAARMSTLIDDLLEFSRTSRTELRVTRVDLDGLVQASIQSLAPDVGERAVAWRVGPLPTVNGDPALLRQVFDNLLSNALKYTRTREQAVIEVSAYTPQGATDAEPTGEAVPGTQVQIGVHDNGVGFDPEYAGKLFGVFQRLHRSEDFEGTGIGLANVRRIVARHGGRVWAESGVPDQPGATFWLTLPLGTPPDAPHVPIAVQNTPAQNAPAQRTP